jgi:hypothetical protein
MGSAVASKTRLDGSGTSSIVSTPSPPGRLPPPPAKLKVPELL